MIVIIYFCESLVKPEVYNDDFRRFDPLEMAQHDILLQIRQIRKQKKLSQGDLAERLHIALKTYQNIENGITRIDIDRLIQITEILDVPLSIILQEKGDDTRNAVKDTVAGEEKKLYDKIITDKEKYIHQLEEHIRFYQEILKENKAFPGI